MLYLPAFQFSASMDSYGAHFPMPQNLNNAYFPIRVYISPLWNFGISASCDTHPQNLMYLSTTCFPFQKPYFQPFNPLTFSISVLEQNLLLFAGHMVNFLELSHLASQEYSSSVTNQSSDLVQNPKLDVIEPTRNSSSSRTIASVI